MIWRLFVLLCKTVNLALIIAALFLISLFFYVRLAG